jgi:hypothetical protein
MKKRDDNPSKFDPNDYPSMKKVLLTFVLFPFGFYFVAKTDKDYVLTRKVYALTTLVSAFIYFAIIVAIIVQ